MPEFRIGDIVIIVPRGKKHILWDLPERISRIWKIDAKYPAWGSVSVVIGLTAMDQEDGRLSGSYPEDLMHYNEDIFGVIRDDTSI